MVSVSLLYQNYVSNTRPKILGIITKILYSADNISFKGSFLCDQIPRIINKQRIFSINRKQCLSKS